MPSICLLVQILNERPIGPGPVEISLSQLTRNLYSIDNYSDQVTFSYARKIIEDHQPLVIFYFEDSSVPATNLRLVFSSLRAFKGKLQILTNFKSSQLKILSNQHITSMYENVEDLEEKILPLLQNKRI